MSACDEDSEAFHAESGLCFGLYDTKWRKFAYANGAEKMCETIASRVAMPNTQSKVDFLKTSPALDGLSSFGYQILLSKLLIS